MTPPGHTMNEPTNYNGPIILSLEIEDDEEQDEIDSLMRETNGNGENGTTTVARSTMGKTNRFLNAVLSRNFDFRQRQNVTLSHHAHGANGSGGATTTNAMLGFVRSNVGHASLRRNFAVLAVLAGCSMLLVRVLNADVRRSPVVKTQARSPHAPKLGGNRNSNHFQQQQQPPTSEDLSWYTAAMAAAGGGDDDGYYYDDAAAAPKSNVGAGVHSVTKVNRENAPGHYLHDPVKSPYASPFYKAWDTDAAGRAAAQADFDARMARYAALYGQWVAPPWSAALAAPDFRFATHGDLEKLPSSAWQADATYVPQFLHQAKLLVDRVKEGIYAEYGYGTLTETSTAKKNDVTAKRLEAFKVIRGDRLVLLDGAAVDPQTERPLAGIAYVNSAAWEGLIRKLLHAMITTDEFYVVLVGNANAYAGNNFQQSAVMEFNAIMEPVFDRLGVRLMARNMGMNATTSVAALGGADITGEADVLWHVPDTRPGVTLETPPAVDLLLKQAVLSGARLPVLLTPDPGTALLHATGDTAWLGNLQPGASFCDQTLRQDGKMVVPAVKACRFVNCGPGADCDRHNSVCWVERSDQHPTASDAHVGHQNEGYPSYQTQRLQGRKMAMLLLHALDEALDRWMVQERKGVRPLPNDMWHVGAIYEQERDKVRTLGAGECDRLFRKIDPNICRVEMHAYTEWTPRANPKNSLKSLVKSPVGDNHASMVEVYTNVDLLPPQWKSADDDVDVHMIAIATDRDALSEGMETDLVRVPGDSPWSPYNDDFKNEDYDGSTKEDHDFAFDDDVGGSDNGSTGRKQRQRMTAVTSDVSPRLWTVYNAPLGFCDGSAQSRCNRNIFNTCLLSNYNHYRAGIIAHGKSGKLSLSLPNVKEGIVLARFDWQLENGPRVKFLPPDFAFLTTVNGETKSIGRSEFATKAVDITGDLRLHVLLLDKEMARNVGETKTIDIDLEVRSDMTGLKPLILLSHIYYA